MLCNQHIDLGNRLISVCDLCNARLCWAHSFFSARVCVSDDTFFAAAQSHTALRAVVVGRLAKLRLCRSQLSFFSRIFGIVCADLFGRFVADPQFDCAAIIVCAGR